MSKFSRGFTLIELVVTIAIAAIIATAAVPMISDYNTNSRLREAGNALLADALFAQSEAIKRNGSIQFSVAGGQVTVTDLAGNSTLRQHALPPKIYATTATITFGGAGRSTVFGQAVQVDVSMADVNCSDQYRCPRLGIDGGGGVRLFSNKLDPNNL